MTPSINFPEEKFSSCLCEVTCCLIWENIGSGQNVWYRYLVWSSEDSILSPHHSFQSHCSTNLKHARSTTKLFEYYKNFKPFVAPFFSRYKRFFTPTMPTFSRTITQKTQLFVLSIQQNKLSPCNCAILILQVEKRTVYTLKIFYSQY